jgi:hypothetical protein
MPPHEAEAIRQCLPHLPAVADTGPTPCAPDVQQVTIEVTDAGQTQRLVVAQNQVPAELKPLLQQLAARSQYLKRPTTPRRAKRSS